MKPMMSVSRGEGTLAYKDPLCFKAEQEPYRRTKKSDIFSLGVILWEISSGKIPCEGLTESLQVFLYRRAGKRDPPFPETSQEYIDLYSKCWSEVLDDRPSCEEVYRRLEKLLLDQLRIDNQVQKRFLGDMIEFVSPVTTLPVVS